MWPYSQNFHSACINMNTEIEQNEKEQNAHINAPGSFHNAPSLNSTIQECGI